MRRPLLAVCVCLFVCMSAWVQIKNPPPFKTDYTGWAGETVLLTGRVYQKEYRISYGEEILVLYLDSIFYSEEPETVSINQMLFSKKLSDLNSFEKVKCEIKVNQLPGDGYVPKVGSKVILQGTWQGFSHATNPGEFDAANYYAVLGIGACVREAKLYAAGEDFWYIREFLYQCKQKWLQNIYLALPQKEASILAKMLLGDGSGLDEEIRELYQTNGIVHILSISGLHITMLGMGVYRLLRRVTCPIVPAAIAGAVVIVFYGMMIGFGISACRAIGMYLIHMLGEVWGKSYDMLTAMGILAVGMLFRNPYLVYHSGFLLSFFSVCSVGFVAPAFQLPQEWFRRQPGEPVKKTFVKKFLQKTAGSISVSLAVTLFTLPLQFYFFYKVPVYSVLLNLFVIPVMSTVMVLGILLMVCPPLSFLGIIEVGILAWFEWLCCLFEKFPGHTWVAGKPQMWQVLLYYVFFVLLLCARKHLPKMWLYVGVLGGLILISIRFRPLLQITILDVGQGDCICVLNKQGDCILFDGGSSSREKVGEKVILPFLEQQGVSHVDAVFLSHGDADHCNGVLQFLKEDLIDIDTLYLPAVGTKAREDFTEILESVRDTTIQYVAAKEKMKWGDIDINCFHPVKGYEAQSNEYSACYLLRRNNFTMLFTGDIEGDGERELSREIEKNRIHSVDVLKVAHHGSRNATSQDFLDTLDMRLAVISCGRKNKSTMGSIQFNDTNSVKMA